MSMKRLSIVTAVMTVLALNTAGASPQEIAWKGGGGWGHRGGYGRVYNPQTVETIAGEVVTVDRFTPAKGMSHGVHLTVRTDKEAISVHLGPSWYIENQDVKILPKDKIEVKGSRVTYEGKPAIVAATLTKGNEQLVLRDAAGFPVWSGWRHR
jgi:hypothetical protein